MHTGVNNEYSTTSLTDHFGLAVYYYANIIYGNISVLGIIHTYNWAGLMLVLEYLTPCVHVNS